MGTGLSDAPWHKQAGSFDQTLMEIFQRAAVQAPDFAADEDEIGQQFIDLPAVCLGMLFEHDHVEIEGRHAA